jgi:hypothetical protein
VWRNIFFTSIYTVSKQTLPGEKPVWQIIDLFIIDLFIKETNVLLGAYSRLGFVSRQKANRLLLQ